MRRLVLIAAVSALPLLTACAGGAAGPQSGLLPAGQEISGTLAEGDLKMSDQSWYDPYLVTARAGERLRFAMSSSQFDTFLAIGRAGQADAFEMLANDDDGAGQGANSLLDFTAPAAGTYELRANSLSPGETGGYTLSLMRRGMAPPPPPPGNLLVGGEVQGELASSDSQTAEGNAYDDYAVTARAGQRLQAIMRSDAFDTHLAIARREGGFTELKSDDDGLGEGTNSRLNFTAPADGEYLLRARSFTAGGQGAYNLTLTDRGAAPPTPAPTRIALSERVTGALVEGDAVNDDDGLYDAYVVAVRKGQRLSVTLTAEGFDTVVGLGRQGPASYDELVSDDDGGPGSLNSRATWVAVEDGDYVVQVRAFGTTGGDYVLEVVDLGPEPAATPVVVGQTIAGELAEGDGYANDHSLYDAYEFEARAGQRLSAMLSSEAFDTVLALGQAGPDGAFTLVSQDDDGAGSGTNSRIGWRAPADGRYLLRASALGGAGAGPYTLVLSDLGPEPPAGPIEVGVVTQGQLALGDALADDSSFYDGYAFQARAGDRLQIIMRSGDFDTYLMVGRRTATGFEALGTDDDGLSEGTNSRLYFTAPADGTYEVRANALSPGDTGAYAVTVETRPADPEPGSAVIGSTLRGALADGDAVADDNSLFDAYRIQAQAGDRLRFSMTSNAFDTFLMLTRTGANGLPEVVGSDDDGLSDTNSRLDYDVTQPGEYVIRANSYGAMQKGEYVLVIERRPEGEPAAAPASTEDAHDHAH